MMAIVVVRMEAGNLHLFGRVADEVFLSLSKRDMT